MWSKGNKRTRLLILLCALALVALGVVLAVGLLIPYWEAGSAMNPEGSLSVLTCSDGTLQVQWPEGDNAGGYRLQVLTTDGTELHSVETTTCSAVLPQFEDRELELRVTSLNHYGGKVREGKTELKAAVPHISPRIHDLKWQSDEEFDTVDVEFDMSEGSLCSVYLSLDGAEPVLVEQVRDGKVQLRFGVDDVFPVPAYGQQLQVTFRLERTAENVFCQGGVTEGFTLTREDFLGRDLHLEQTYNGDNSYTFTWNETKGEYYDVRLSEDDGNTWETMAYIPSDRERSFTMPSLKAFTDCSVSVAAVGGQTMADSEFAAVSEHIEIRTGEKLLYSTIWPLTDQKVYSDSEGAEELGKVAAGSAWCVLGQEGKYLKIRYNGQDAYIDGDYCMINLPEYIGNLCSYDITNSYSSIYLVHEYGIRDVSGTVITGYEDVQIGEDEYLVPLLFPVAQRLIKAGLAARAQGYTLKIYDSFRPQKATDDIYSKTKSILNHLIPDRTFSGKEVTDLNWISWNPETGQWGAPEPIYGDLTYRRLMTNNGAYSLSAFLASGTSRHNYGLALDLTLEDATGAEVPMQTSMHDLSWYSASSINNANATILRGIMEGAGFMGIASEWWHFQDQEAYFSHGYKPLRTGVNWECWVADNHGWRYRLPDGSFYANSTEVIEGESYTFDENGYLMQ